MRRFRSVFATVAVLAAFAGASAVAAPAQAATYCTTKGQKYFCEYGISTTKFLNGTKEEFVVGPDHAVWTNWTNPDGSWNGWVSMGGWVKSRIEVTAQEQPNSIIQMSAIGKDDGLWLRFRYSNGVWTDWQPTCWVNPNGHFCP